nr:response regulator [Elizabethkingia sp. ASV34]
MELYILIIDDNPKLKDDALVWELEAKYGKNNVFFISDPNEALSFLKSNLDKNVVVLLDIQFPSNEMNGHHILAEIRKLSELIPVILWSGIDENNETFSDFINNNAFKFIGKTIKIKEAMLVIEQAVDYFKTNLDNSIEDWIIQKDEDKNKPVYFTSDGKSYSLNDILYEIRTQSDVGKSFARKLNELTIDLLLRKKEQL